MGETSTTAPVITEDIPKAGEELKAEATPAPIVAAPAEELKTEETPAKAAEEKPKPTKRGSIFGSFVEKLKSPREEKKEPDFGASAAPVKEAETVPEASKPLEEAVVAAPATPVPESTTTEPSVSKPEETKSVPTGTPVKEKEHFSFGKFFGNKERAKSPAATEKAHEPIVDATAPKIEDTTAPATTEPVEPVEPVAPVVESKPEPIEEKKDEAPKKEKRSSSFFGTLTRSLSKATGKDAKKDVKHNEQTKETPATVPEASEDAPVVADKKDETPAADATPVDAPVEKTIGDVPAEAVTVGEPKSNPTVATTA